MWELVVESLSFATEKAKCKAWNWMTRMIFNSNLMSSVFLITQEREAFFIQALLSKFH